MVPWLRSRLARGGAVGVFGAALSFASLARADLEGQQACLNREAGSSCTRSSGAIGTCVAEPTVPGVLTCDPDTAAGGAGVGAGTGGQGAGGGQAQAGSAGYPGTGTGAQGGSVDGPGCNVSPRLAGEPRPTWLEPTALVLAIGGALVCGRRRSGRSTTTP